MPEIRILIASDHALLSNGIHALLKLQADIRVLGIVASTQETLVQAGDLYPDIILMDSSLPELGGEQTTQIVREKFPEIKILMLTMREGYETIKSLLKAGASGYITRRQGPADLIKALRRMHDEGDFLEPVIARLLLEDYSTANNTETNQISTLTDREREVLYFTTQGNTSKEIAAILDISPKTVSVHMTNIKTKLGVRNTYELIRYATRHHLIDFEY
jgi:two-component system response regulator NreC